MRCEPLPFASLPGRAIRGLHRYAFSLLGERLYFRGARLRGAPRGRPRLVIRVDDFPRWDLDTHEYAAFHELFRVRQAPYVLGVTPFLDFHGEEPYAFSAHEIELLRRASAEGAVLAVHGFTHRERIAPDGFPCETAFYRDDELLEWIGRAFKWFREHELPRPEHYIPPFNTLGPRDVRLLGQHFAVVHGGPLSLSTFGRYGASASDGVVYLPSFEPFYDRAGKIARALEDGERRLTRTLPYAVTLHWAWERPNGYRDVGPLLDALAARGWLADPAELRRPGLVPSC